MSAAPYHVPVLAREVAALATGRGRVVDGTVGGGGHTALFLEAGATVMAIDRDPEALHAATERLKTKGVKWLNTRFAAPEALAAVRAFRPDLILLDLGVSSRQLDHDARGFSFRPGVPLDMRMHSGQGATAAELLNQLTEDDLARVFRDFGDERHWRKLARVVSRRRRRGPFHTADDLVNAIRETLGPTSGPPDFARLFQAVRMAVNRELEELEEALPMMLDGLVPEGILAVITYHSGEDRVVKHLFREWARSCVCPPHQPVCTCRGHALGARDPRKPIAPSAAEIADNPRARSAKLRIFRKARAG